jgi:hypothetical protein
MSVPAIRPTPNLIGETRVGDTITAVAKDTKRVASFTLSAPTRIVKLSLACDGGGGAAPNNFAKLRPVIYQGNALIAMGDEVTVASGDPVRWVDLSFLAAFPSGVVVGAGTTELGVIVGGDPNVLRVAQIDPLAPGGRWNADTYTDGATTTFGTATSLTANMSIFATASPVWVERDTAQMDVIARLGWTDAQRLLLSATLVSPIFSTTAGWHGTVVDPNRGSFAVVRNGGPLADLVGERLKLTTVGNNARTCLVYVFQGVSSLEHDISLARRAFASLELLAKDTVDVKIEVLA